MKYMCSVRMPGALHQKVLKWMPDKIGFSLLSPKSGLLRAYEVFNVRQRQKYTLEIQTNLLRVIEQLGYKLRRALPLI